MPHEDEEAEKSKFVGGREVARLPELNADFLPHRHTNILEAWWLSAREANGSSQRQETKDAKTACQKESPTSQGHG